MEQSNTDALPQFTPCARLAALGSYLQQIQLFAPIRARVRIAQKTLTPTPLDKLYDACITILAGAHGLVEVNTRLRSDPVLPHAFGRTACADQSTIQATLNACTTDNVHQLLEALITLYRPQSQGYHHNYARQWQILDAAMPGAPGGPQAAWATTGYFANQRKRKGRQLGRVLARRYRAVVIDHLVAGTPQLTTALRPRIDAAEQVLELDAAKRQRTILRVDAGGGSLDDSNWGLSRGYPIQTTDCSTVRASRLAARVTEWLADPAIAGRQVGWGATPATDYLREVRRIAVRGRTKNGQWGSAVISSTLTPRTVIAETGLPLAQVRDQHAVRLADVHFDDQRGGGVETAIKNDQQGVGMTKRNQKRFAAQQLLLWLGVLAHTVIGWATRWLAPHAPKVRRYGRKRMVRASFHISGRIVRNAHGQIVQMILNQAAPLVRGLARSLDVLLRPTHVAVNWGQI